jgi:hypothetical protein
LITNNDDDDDDDGQHLSDIGKGESSLSSSSIYHLWNSTVMSMVVIIVNPP